MKKDYKYYIIHKPYKILSQFSDENGNPGLGSVYNLPKNIYPVGRLDLDSEGLLILTDDKSLNNKLLNPNHKHKRTYWVEVDGIPDQQKLDQFSTGIQININGKRHQTVLCEVKLIEPENVDERVPPVNYLKHPVRCWLEIKLTEGKNRQVRRMTAAIGHPTLRVIRVAIEDLHLFPLKSGEIAQVSEKLIYQKLKL
jgi:23S rRNA pseudouridine2457 synthase